MSSILDNPEFKPYANRWAARQQELARRRAYYDGSIYGKDSALGRIMGSLAPALGLRLYRGTKALYLPLSRAVDVDAGIIPGGWKLFDPVDTAEAAEQGIAAAGKAEPASNPWQAAMDQVFDWSNWARDGVLYVHYGAMYGVSVLRVCDIRPAPVATPAIGATEAPGPVDLGRVIIEPNDPSCVLLIPSGQYDKTPRLAIYVAERYDDEGKPYEYAEVIEADRIRTFVKGQLEGVDGRQPEYRNALGFVPFVEVRHIETGDTYGECTYQKAIPLLDEVNELASYLADIVKKHAEPQWMMIGAEPSDLVKSGDNVWFGPPGSDAKALVAAIDIKGVLEFIKEIRDQVFGALPELSFEELKQKEQIATATLELQLMELVLKVKRCRPNYDHGLADALRMCARAAATMGMGELAALDDEGLRFDPERPVIPLDRMSQIALEQQELALDMQRNLDPASMEMGFNGRPQPKRPDPEDEGD